MAVFLSERERYVDWKRLPVPLHHDVSEPDDHRADADDVESECERLNHFGNASMRSARMPE